MCLQFYHMHPKVLLRGQFDKYLACKKKTKIKKKWVI